MGVSGSGKSTLAKRIASMTGARFLDADDFHSRENVAKMRTGLPLDDSDRQPWLLAIVDAMHKADGPTVIACSALKRGYRDVLRKAGDVFFVHPTGDPSVIRERIQSRQNHFMPSSLLDSQLQALEDLQDDEAGVTVRWEQPLDEEAAAAVAALREWRARPVRK